MNQKLKAQAMQLFIVAVLTLSLYFGIAPLAAWLFLSVALMGLMLALGIAWFVKRNGHGG